MEKLGKYCKIISGYAFKSNDLSEGTEIPVIKIGNISNGDDVITDSSTQYVSSDFLSIDEKYHIKKGDVLISLTGSHINQPNSMVGRSCRNFSDTEFLLNQRAGKVIPNENADKNYLYYLLNTESFKYSICNRAYGAANQANVSPSDIENIKWNFPPLPTQKKIASILSAYDDLIQNYKKQIEALQTAASELYKEWFVRFRFPGYQNTKFENGIPEGWKYLKLSEFGYEAESGNRPFGGIDGSLEDGIPSLGAESIDKLGYFDYSNVKLVPREFYDKMKRGHGKENDILLYKDGAYIGKVTLFRNGFPFNEYAVNEHVFLLRSNNKNYQNHLYFTLNMPQYFTQMQNLNRNAAQPGLVRGDLDRIKILAPDEKIIEKFNKFINPIIDNVFSYSKQITNLTQQRDLLLPRLMSGKLEIK